MKYFSQFILRLWGWKLPDNTPKEKKYIMIVAPHTSYWDFVVGRLAMWSIGVPMKVFIKKEVFVFPFGILLKAIGAIPVDRKKAGSKVANVCELIQKEDRMGLVITPEGTRKRTSNWKKGFYYIAKRSGLPLYAGILDYKQKTCEVVGPFELSDDSDADMKRIKEHYVGVTAKHPNQFCI